MSDVATVFIVDDDPAARESVSAVVESKGLRAIQFDSAEQFLADFRGERHACLLVDVRMTGMTGIELQEQLVAAGKQIPTILVTGYGNIPMAVQAMQNGAITFLEKPCSQDALWNSIELALQQAHDLQQAQERQDSLRDRFSRLSKNEREVLLRVIDGQPNKRIATELDIGLRTVELRRSQIMKKIQANSLSELIRMAIEVGFPNDVPAPTAESEALPS